MPSSGSCHTIGRVVNSLITALNTHDRLPRLVVIMLDKDLIEDVGIYDHCAEDVIAQNLDWLIRQIEVAIKRRRMELTDIKPGAVYGSDPKIVLVEMIRRPLVFPLNSVMYQVLALRKKFNAILNDAALHFGYHRMYLEACTSEYLFDRLGKLNEEGKIEMWREIDALIEKFDCKKINLKPVSYDQERNTYIQRHRCDKAQKSAKHFC